MRRLLAFLCLLALCSCDNPQVRRPFTDSRVPAGLPVRAWPPEGWAWGLVQLRGAPVLRYGVTAPGGVARSQVLILPDYGEPAEAWFEADQRLLDRGYGVWTLEPAGQGGSGRSVWERDAGHAPDFTADVAALGAMRAIVHGRATVYVAQGAAAPILMDAVRSGLPAQGVVLSAPLLTPAFTGPDMDAVESVAPGLETIKLGWLRAFGQQGWRAPSPMPEGRAAVIPLWQEANPALRIGGPSFGYIAAFGQEAAALKGGALARVAAPVLILHAGARPTADELALCRRLPHCQLQAIAAAHGSLHLESDEALAAWTSAVGAFIDRTTPPPGR